MAFAAVDSAACRDIHPYILSSKKHVLVAFWGNGALSPTLVCCLLLCQPLVFLTWLLYDWMPFACSLETMYLSSGSCVYNNHESRDFGKKVLKGKI